VLYPLDEVLLLRLLAVLAGSKAITDIVRFGEKKLELLRRFRPFRDGMPSHHHLGDILATLHGSRGHRCVPVPRRIAGYGIPRKGLSALTREPGLGWVLGNVEVDDASSPAIKERSQH
jgi:hypothetical protein